MTRAEIEALAGGSAANWEYLNGLILDSLKPGPGFLRMVLILDQQKTKEQIDAMVADGVINQVGDMYSVDWVKLYSTGGSDIDEELRRKCLDASEAITRYMMAEEALSRLKFIYGGKL